MRPPSDLAEHPVDRRSQNSDRSLQGLYWGTQNVIAQGLRDFDQGSATIEDLHDTETACSQGFVPFFFISQGI